MGSPYHMRAPIAPRDSASSTSPNDIVNAVLISLSIIFVTLLSCLRTYYRRKAGNTSFQPEDWVHLAALLGYYAQCATLIVGYLGNKVHSNAPDDRKSVFGGKPAMAGVIMFSVDVLMIKLSILLFMFRLFSCSRIFLVVARMSIVLSTTVCALAIASILSQCTPISAFWSTNPEYAMSHCTNRVSHSLLEWDLIINLINEIIMLSLPAMVILRLKLSPKKKLRIMLLLCSGGIALIPALSRLIIFKRFEAGKVSSLENHYYGAMSWVEPAIGLVICCICFCGPSFDLLRQIVFGGGSECDTDSDKECLTIIELSSNELPKAIT